METTPNYQDKYGKPVTGAEYERLTRDRKYCTIKESKVASYRVSTVWLGPPFWELAMLKNFETAVFDEDDRPVEGYTYETIEEAERGHEAIVQQWIKKVSI
jgi:hypothetical protein